MAKRLTSLFEAGCEWGYEQFDRRANDPDEEDVEMMQEGLAESLAAWLPDYEFTPAKKVLVAAGFMVMGMGIGSEKIERKKTEAIAAAASRVPPAALRPAPPTPPPAPLERTPLVVVRPDARDADTTGDATRSPPSSS